MVYDWDAHQETCYQLYIQEGRPLEDIMDHLRTVHAFCPSKRAFQTQFRRWNFPAKQRPAHKNDRLVARIKELWEKNLPQREMLRILNEEDGYDIKPRELMRVRTKNRWLLRVPNVTTADAMLPGLPDNGEDHDNDDGTGDDDNDEDSGQRLDLIALNHSCASSTRNSSVDMVLQDSDGGNGTPAAAAGGRRSRRRARPGGQDALALPTTASGNTRFPSEMTIDEARDILSLDTATYRTLRTNFQQICHEDNLSRKTEAGPERWAAAKQRLVGSLTALQRILWAGSSNAAAVGGAAHCFDQRQLALDVICTDVTKRLRTLETRMTLGEAKTVLGVNPAESRDMRAALHAVLSEARFASKSDATPQQWEGLKRQWARRAPRVRAILDDNDASTPSGGADDEVRARLLRALETVASDVMKRLRDQRRSRQSLAAAGSDGGGGGKSQRGQQQQQQQQHQQHQQQQQQHQHQQEESQQPMSATSQSSPSTTHDQMDIAESLAGSNFDDLSEVSHMTFGSPNGSADGMHMSLALSQASPLTGDSLQRPVRGVLNAMNATAMQLGSSPGLGPALLLSSGDQAAAAAAAFMGHHPTTSFYDPSGIAGSSVAAAAGASSNSRSSNIGAVPACAVYLRLHPSSSFITGTELWVATLGPHASVQELREAAVERFPGAACARVEGIIKDGKGGELPLQIEQEQELAAYLAHMQGASPTFNVQLIWKGT
ncbi:d-lactate dehydrogenase protein [Cordyceps javanica]|uniref:D-lactate dehydrogenase protein n=1 Tax=Cordyceps javanica TaxID=43265 RepID=A0A545W0N0_9HYPO|nr:d-lactate dehydrogenase protein [Cordyceps javanica]TQW07532.1 Clr5 domain-containing protein [Cordyceps javanica]